MSSTHPDFLFLVVPTIFMFGAWLCLSRRIARQIFFATLLAIFLGLILGFLRADIQEKTSAREILSKYIDQEVQITGVITEEPDLRERSMRLSVKIISINEIEVSSRTAILVTTSRYPEHTYGDKLQLEGKLKNPSNFRNENGREFNYVKYLEKSGIRYTLFFPEITFVEKGHGNPVKSALFSVKRSWLSSVERLIPDPHVSLLGGLVVGAKQSLGEELEDKFRDTGIIHIVVLSGYNVTIIAEAIMRVFSFLPKAIGLSFGAISIIFFAIMTGGSATIVRASIMALLVLLARATGRTSEITHALFLAGFFMVLHNPMIVLYDPSFQLSFLATLGLIYLAPQLEKYFNLLPTRWQLREFATATIATQIFVLPLILYMMGELSLVALPVNLLILGLIPLTMLFGFLAGVLGFVSSTLAFPFTVLSYVLLAYELLVVELFASLSFATISIPSFPLWLMFSIYILYIFVLFKLSARMRAD